MDKGNIVLDGEPRTIFNSEKARLIGIGIPKATRLYQLLKDDGVNLGNKVPINSEEASDLLRKTLSDD